MGPTVRCKQLLCCRGGNHTLFEGSAGRNILCWWRNRTPGTCTVNWRRRLPFCFYRCYSARSCIRRIADNLHVCTVTRVSPSAVMLVPTYTYRTAQCCDRTVIRLVVAVSKGTPKGGGAAGLQHSPTPPPKTGIKNRFCRYYDIKTFTWFPLQPKSATEIGWWPVH
jgi:hypothetical protein